MRAGYRPSYGMTKAGWYVGIRETEQAIAAMLADAARR
jgi:hypothetical protein